MGPRCGANGFHPRTTESVDRHCGNVGGQTGQQGAHAPDITVVFTGLVGTAHKDIADHGRIEFGVSGQQGTQRYSREIIRSDTREHAAIAANGGSYGIINQGICHVI